MAAAKSATQMLVYAVTLRRGEHPAKVSQRWIHWQGILGQGRVRESCGARELLQMKLKLMARFMSCHNCGF